MADHAILSASGSKKWLTCTPSARLEETFKDEDTEFSKEGSKAHELMEIALRMFFFHELSAGDVSLRTVEGRRKAGFTAEMDAAVESLQARVAEVTKQLDKDKVAYTVFIEHKVDYSQWAQEGFGTADVIVVTTKKVWVFDLKYGKGVTVDAKENTQMMLYGLGAWADLSMAYDDIETISLNIHQPRIGNFSSWEISLTDLLAWGETVKQQAALAWEGIGDFVPGGHCDSGFCKARFTCKARASACLDASAALTRPELMTAEDIALLLPKLDSIEKWAKGMKEYAQKTAIEESVRYPGWKLVEGKSNRYIADKNLARTRLTANGFPESDFMTKPDLVGLTALEELVGGKKAFTELMGDIIHKPAGKPTLVPASDNRPEWQGAISADEEFAD
jgi:hypothetical protein